MSRVQRPDPARLAHVNTHALDGRVAAWTDDMADYADQLEADNHELVEALERCERDLRVMATWAPRPHQDRPRRTADAARALIANHKGDSDGQ